MSADVVSTELRVRYNETDRMRVVHHTSYFVWFEMGRTEFMRAVGTSYRELEEHQVYMPVIETHCRFQRSARYDEMVRVETRCERLKRVRIRFNYRVVRAADGELLAEGWTAHAPTDAGGVPRRLPAQLLRALFPEEATGS